MWGEWLFSVFSVDLIWRYVGRTTTTINYDILDYKCLIIRHWDVILDLFVIVEVVISFVRIYMGFPLIVLQLKLICLVSTSSIKILVWPSKFDPFTFSSCLLSDDLPSLVKTKWSNVVISIASSILYTPKIILARSSHSDCPTLVRSSSSSISRSFVKSFFIYKLWGILIQKNKSWWLAWVIRWSILCLVNSIVLLLMLIVSKCSIIWVYFKIELIE